MSFKHVTQITVMNFQERDYEIGSFTSLGKVVNLDHQNRFSGYKKCSSRVFSTRNVGKWKI